MLDMIERQTRLTINQWKIIVAAILGDMLDFFDFYLIGYVLAFIVGPWNLHARPVGDGSDVGRGNRRGARRLLLGLDGRQGRAPQGVQS